MGALRIKSRSGEAFGDRVDAGVQLGKLLHAWGVPADVVLGIPRGGVIVAREVADVLDACLDVAIARKLPSPWNRELAIGAVAEGGEVYANPSLAAATGADHAYLEEQKRAAVEEIRRRAQLFRVVRPKAPLAGKCVLVTDDGVATGATMQAVIWAVRAQSPGRLIVALPVGPQDTLQRLAESADEVCCLLCPPFFEAVGQFYRVFDQASEEEVLDILRREAGKVGAR